MIQLLLLLAISPLISGLIKTLKARMQAREFCSSTGTYINCSAREW